MDASVADDSYDVVASLFEPALYLTVKSGEAGCSRNEGMEGRARVEDRRRAVVGVSSWTLYVVLQSVEAVSRCREGIACCALLSVGESRLQNR